MSAAHRAFQLLRTLLGYTWAMVSLIVFIPIGLLTRPFDPRQWVHDRLSTVWAKGILGFAGARLEISGQSHVVPGERYVVVANHQSLLDAMVMVASLQPLTPVRMMAKRSLFYVPILGWGMRAFGHMPVDHRSMRASLDGLKQAQSTVSLRGSTVFFPEGTRSPDGQLLPFHNAAFHIAARAGVRVLPVTLSGSRHILPKSRTVLVRAGEIQVQIHAPVAMVGQSLDEVRASSEQVRAIIASALDPDGPRSVEAAPAAG